MQRPTALIIAAMFLAAGALAQSPRFVIDDDEYLERVVAAAMKLMQEGRLAPMEKLRAQAQKTRHYALKTTPISREKLAPPDLHDRLLASTFAVGPIYKCPDCADWHFNGGAAFVVADEGVVSTCCHVVTADDEEMKEAYLIAADSAGHVFPVKQVLASDPDSDTCFVKIETSGLKPLPLRPGVRTGERVYCLSHPGGNHFMFTEGMVSRVTRSRNMFLDDHGATNTTRPILYLNITAEFAPGSSGAPVVDESGNVVGQVTSIADAGEPLPEDTSETAPASPSVPVRFCIAAEEIQGISRSKEREATPATRAKSRRDKGAR